jgi:transposase-like protein
MLRGLAPAGSSIGLRLIPLPGDAIVMAVHWHVRYGLPYRDVEELLAEHGIEVLHVTVYRWLADGQG